MNIESKRLRREPDEVIAQHACVRLDPAPTVCWCVEAKLEYLLELFVYNRNRLANAVYILQAPFLLPLTLGGKKCPV